MSASEMLDQFALPTGTFGYSAISLDDERIGATEYTLVTIAVDVSGSVHSYKTEMEEAIKEIVDSCNKSPRKDNLMIRIVTFDDDMQEMHGFKLLVDCNASDYTDCLTIGGCTALFDASNNAIEATNDYAKKLGENEFDANAIVVIITDGCDNRSNAATPATIKKTLQASVQEESLESMLSILVGVGVSGYSGVAQALDDFKNEAGITQYVEIADANSSTLAKLAKFVSQSISAQSQALGTGGPSQALQF
jgi:uncharacterized protein YegL